MRVVVQKCLQSSVTVDGKVISQISNGLMVLVGFTDGDTEKEIDYMTRKVVHLRIFEDENGINNLSVLDQKKEILCVSQFTLYGNVKNGNRPSYIEAMNGEEATKLYDLFCKKLNAFVPTKKGVFGADMKVELINDGPMTIFIDSKN